MENLVRCIMLIGAILFLVTLVIASTITGRRILNIIRYSILSIVGSIKCKRIEKRLKSQGAVYDEKGCFRHF